MKIPTLVLSSVLMLAVSGAAIAAEQEKKGTRNRCAEEWMTKRISRMDTDKDGKVSDAEIAAMQVRSIDRSDKNDDGVLDLEEYKTAGRRPRPEGAEKRFAAIDADKSGTISPAENEAYQRNQMKGNDTDKDGFVTVQELVANCTPRPPKE